MSENVRECPRMSDNAGECLRMSKNVQECPRMSKNVREWPIMAHYVLKCPALFLKPANALLLVVSVALSAVIQTDLSSFQKQWTDPLNQRELTKYSFATIHAYWSEVTKV